MPSNFSKDWHYCFRAERSGSIGQSRSDTMATRRNRGRNGGDGNAWGSRGKDARYLHNLCGYLSQMKKSDRTLLLSFPENIRRQKKSRPE
jgi:hypothetical protein